MNPKRIVLGGIAGGFAFFLVQGVIHNFVLAHRYEILQNMGHLKTEPRIPFLVGAVLLVDLAAGIGLAWLYAAARSALGPGPRTALFVGLVAGLLYGVPSFLSHFSWTQVGGVVSMWWSLDPIVGFTIATLLAGWLYRD